MICKAVKTQPVFDWNLELHIFFFACAKLTSLKFRQSEVSFSLRASSPFWAGWSHLISQSESGTNLWIYFSPTMLYIPARIINSVTLRCTTSHSKGVYKIFLHLGIIDASSMISWSVMTDLMSYMAGCEWKWPSRNGGTFSRKNNPPSNPNSWITWSNSQVSKSPSPLLNNYGSVSLKFGAEVCVKGNAKQPWFEVEASLGFRGRQDIWRFGPNSSLFWTENVCKTSIS